MTDDPVTAIVRRAEARYQERRHSVMAKTDRMFAGSCWANGCSASGSRCWSRHGPGGQGAHAPRSRLGGDPAWQRHQPAGGARVPTARLGGHPSRHRGRADALVRAAHSSFGRAHRDPLPRLRSARFPGGVSGLDGAVDGYAGGCRPHFVRGLVWPESVYGIVNPEWWRLLRHAFWVVFGVAFLVRSCFMSLRDMPMAADKGAELEALSEGEWRRSSVLEREAAAAP